MLLPRSTPPFFIALHSFAASYVAWIALPKAGQSSIAAYMLVVENLSYKYGPVVAVDHISFSVGKGEIVGFLGPNGAGKTTTIKMLAGVLVPAQGRVEIDGVNPVEDLARSRQKIGYLPEGAPLYQQLTPNQSLHYLLMLAGWSPIKARARIAEILDILDLTSRAHQKIGTLSKGFQRRCALAMALITDPKLLLLDEPFDGFDPMQKRAGRAMLTSMAKEKSILICTHSLAEAKSLCDRILILDRGQLVATGSVEQIQRQTGKPDFEQAFCALVGAAR